jgi:hypothetical protein
MGLREFERPAARDLDTPAQKAARRGRGGVRKLTREELDKVWDEVQSKTREGLGWKAPQK